VRMHHPSALRTPLVHTHSKVLQVKGFQLKGYLSNRYLLNRYLSQYLLVLEGGCIFPKGYAKC